MSHSRCVEKLPHNTDKCHSRDGLQVFIDDKGNYSGFCFSCGTYVHDPYSDKPKGYKPQIRIKSPEEIEKDIQEIRDEYRTVDLPDRKLKKEYLGYFGIRIGTSEADGVTPISHYYPYTKDGEVVGYKVRIIEGKKIYSVGNQKEVDLFGWEQAKLTGAKSLYITEGELDAVALTQIIVEKNKGTQYEKFFPAVVSIQHGALTAKKI